jgi:hypothetical protein
MSIARDDAMGLRDIYKLALNDEKVMPYKTVIKGKVILSSPKIVFDKVELKEKKTGKVVCTFGTPSLNTTKDYVSCSACR